jgi:hypothetical protein
MIPALRSLRDVVVSLKLTVLLLVFSMVLIFAGTLDQVNLGIAAVQEKYFRSWIVYLPVGRFVIPAFPGGYTVGGLLLLNLVAAHVYRFRFNWRKAGIFLTHAGLIVLLVGELVTGLLQEDYHLRITEGETKNYAESFSHFELAVIDATDASFDDVIAIPERMLADKAPVQHPKLPFRLATKTYYPNSALYMRSSASPGTEVSPVTTAGVGDHVAASPLPVTYRPDERNVPSAVVELTAVEGTLGTYFVSGHLPGAQTFNYGNRTWKISLRVKRNYQPFSLTLLAFTHDRYPGTEIPKNFSSRLKLSTPGAQNDREVLIRMNEPLRYGGLTFYQAGFENNDQTSVLQVVRNPTWYSPRGVFPPPRFAGDERATGSVRAGTG